MYGDFLEYYFKLQFSAAWSIHGKALSKENANFKMYMYVSFQNKLSLIMKKINLPPPGKS